MYVGEDLWYEKPETLLALFFAWNVSQHIRRVRNKTKQSDTPRSSTPRSSDTPTFQQLKIPFVVKAGLIVEILFMLFSVYNAVKISEYKAY